MADHVRVRAFATVAVLIVGALIVGSGLLLKQDRKHRTKPVVYTGCYAWSDGHLTCKSKRED